MRYLFILLIGGFLISCQKNGCTDPTATNYDPNADNNDGSCQYSSPTPPTTNGAGVTDNDGNSYETVIIGNQEWMAENLRTTTYANGDPILHVIADTQWINLANTETAAWSHYNNDSQYENPYGKLYNWYTVADPRNVCPTGWHVPTDAEWTILTDFLGGETIAGGKMKTTGTIEGGDGLWTEPNTDATNSSGFSGLPGGKRQILGSFIDVDIFGYWWSSTQAGGGAYTRYLGNEGGYVIRGGSPANEGLSCRCLKD